MEWMNSKEETIGIQKKIATHSPTIQNYETEFNQ
jgi:hypothetical protein